MTRLMLLTVQTIALALLASIAGMAQSQDRAKIEKEIEALREQLKQKEEEFLAPSAEDRARFAEFLLQRSSAGATKAARYEPAVVFSSQVRTIGSGCLW